MGVLLLAEHSARRRAGGVVYGREQGKPRASALQQVVLAPIDLHQHPFLGHALPQDTVTRRPAPTRAGQPLHRLRYGAPLP